jgi:hypothetical protein
MLLKSRQHKENEFMSARDTFNAAVVTATKTKVATDLQTEMVRQATLDAANSVVGYTTQSGNYSTLAAAVKNSVAANLAAGIAAEQARQAAIGAARDALRATGDLAPA